MQNTNGRKVNVLLNLINNSIEDYNLRKEQKVLIVFDNMIVVTISNKEKLTPKAFDLFITGKK